MLPLWSEAPKDHPYSGFGDLINSITVAYMNPKDPKP